MAVFFCLCSDNTIGIHLYQYNADTFYKGLKKQYSILKRMQEIHIV